MACLYIFGRTLQNKCDKLDVISFNIITGRIFGLNIAKLNAKELKKQPLLSLLSGKGD